MIQLQNNNIFDFYVLTPIVLTIGGVEYNIELSLFGNFQTLDSVPFVPVPNKFLIEKITRIGCEVTDDKTFELVNKFTSQFFKNNPERFKKLASEELNAFGYLCVRTDLTNQRIKSKI